MALLRQSLSLQEVELVELKERLNNSSQHPEEQRSPLGAEFRTSLLELRGEVEELVTLVTYMAQTFSRNQEGGQIVQRVKQSTFPIII